MAPDLNSVPPSPHSSRSIPASSTRASESMAPPPPPPPPISVPGANLSSQLSRDSPSVMAPSGFSVGDNTGVGFGPGTVQNHDLSISKFDFVISIRPSSSPTSSHRSRSAHAVGERTRSSGMQLSYRARTVRLI